MRCSVEQQWRCTTDRLMQGQRASSAVASLACRPLLTYGSDMLKAPGTWIRRCPLHRRQYTRLHAILALKIYVNLVSSRALQGRSYS